MNCEEQCARLAVRDDAPHRSHIYTKLLGTLCLGSFLPIPAIFLAFSPLSVPLTAAPVYKLTSHVIGRSRAHSEVKERSSLCPPALVWSLRTQGNI